MSSGIELKWGVRKRLEFIEFRLFWYGRFNRPDLADAFGISAQQATNDIAQYQKTVPNNCVYTAKEKYYVRTPEFQPNLILNSTDRYLLQLVAVASGWMNEGETWFQEIPPVEVVSLGRAPIEPLNLLAILDAIRLKQELTIEYQSMTGSLASSRLIAPHAITYSAGRWYARAWNKQHNDFRDYNLNRIRSTKHLCNSEIDFSLDYQWFQQIDLELIPNPKLAKEKQAAVANEYQMENGSLTFPVRLSHAFYLMDQYNLDVEEGKLKPEKQQLILKNRDDVLDATRLARKMSIQALERAVLT